MIRQFTCPVCNQTLPLEPGTPSKFLPFCSERCRRIDFFRWTEGKYAIVEPLDPRLIDPESGETEPD